MRVLLIEDDRMIGTALSTALTREGMSIDWVRNGLDGAEAMLINEYGIVLLDLGLPGLSGVEILKLTRDSGDTVPILIITAKDDIEDRIDGLENGADDYIVKPFEPRELLARMRAVLRRQHGVAQSTLQCGDLTLDLASREVEFRSIKHVLPSREFALVQALIERPGTILSRAQIEEKIYGWGEEVESNAVDVLIHSIRKKFDKDIIRNVRGTGWMILKTTQ